MVSKIAYRFKSPIYQGEILYVNLIAGYSCTNDCIFCSRPRRKEQIGKPNIYEKKAGSSLYLAESPTVEEVMESIDKEIKSADKEIAIIGLGEPLIYLPKVVEVISKIKAKHDIITRVDTNGLVRCRHKDAAEQLEKAGLDQIRISLNAINKKEYGQLCNPQYADGFPNLVSFVKECVRSNIETYVSFIVGFEDGAIKSRSKAEYEKFATSLGVKPENIIFRNHIKAI